MNREERRLWKRMAASCMECGREQVPLPKVIEMWFCQKCQEAYDLLAAKREWVPDPDGLESDRRWGD